jgi:hypothetical protein
VVHAAWSPDAELLALVSGHGQLLLMNKVRPCMRHVSAEFMHDTRERALRSLQDWDVISETGLFNVIDNPVPSRATFEEDVPEVICMDAGSVSISWRGDGKFFGTVSSARTGTTLARPSCVWPSLEHLLAPISCSTTLLSPVRQEARVRPQVRRVWFAYGRGRRERCMPWASMLQACSTCLLGSPMAATFMDPPCSRMVGSACCSLSAMGSSMAALTFPAQACPLPHAQHRWSLRKAAPPACSVLECLRASCCQGTCDVGAILQALSQAWPGVLIQSAWRSS